jgi:GH24 family phage-related lysozyme (muramidase)
MTGNLIGEPIEGFVQEQIGIRQVSQFAGYDDLRTPIQLQHLNNRNAWVKLASSIKISDSKAGNEKLKKLGIESPSSYLGTRLAESAVLFNTLSTYIPNPDQQVKSGGILDSSRAGVLDKSPSTLWNNNFVYGIGATNYGLQPPPGIIGVTVDSLNRGSIRKANVTLKAHNRFQFDILELLYLRLGFTMMLEWGWDKYLGFLNKESNEIVEQQVGNTIIEEKWFTSSKISQIGMINEINNYRTRYSGNYDGFFGKVSNFTWNYNPDGTYDISIDLITIGDIIESLQVNTSSKFQGMATGSVNVPTTEPQEEANNITKASYLNTVGYFLYNKAYEVSANFKQEGSGALFTTSGSITNDGVHNYYIINPSKARPGINTTAKGNQSVQFYIRLKEFFAQLETLVIPLVDGDKQLQFELDSCYMSHFPNQISFDPKVCVFKFPLNYGDIPVALTGDIEGVLNPALSGQNNNYLRSLADYLVKVGDYNYGELMNIYVNFEFISTLLLSNGGPDQKLSLFKFLQDLCNGINSALGGVNKLEPVIKDDYIITIIDQTLASASTKNVIELEVQGYNTVVKSSNFVKDIKFVSKITPQLASTISIGATAAGNAISNLDGTAFSKWSDGLVDRFSTEISEPSGIDFLKKSQAEQQAQEDEATYRREWEGFLDSGNTTNRRIINYASNVAIKVVSFLQNIAGTTAVPVDVKKTQAQIDAEKAELDRTTKKIIGEPYTSFRNTSLTFDQFLPKARAYRAWLASKNIVSSEELQALVGSNYLVYLLNAFGGFTKQYKVPYSLGNALLTANYSVTAERSRYLEFNDSFIAQGKAAYQNYLNKLNADRFKTINVPSSEVGFIPLSFEVLLDGISGIKIYNKLDINNTFLPSNYPESLKFIITKVNHNISNNSWETSLSTVSIPETQPYVFGEFVTPQSTRSESESGGGTGGGTGSGSGIGPVIKDGKYKGLNRDEYLTAKLGENSSDFKTDKFLSNDNDWTVVAVNYIKILETFTAEAADDYGNYRLGYGTDQILVSRNPYKTRPVVKGDTTTQADALIVLKYQLPVTYKNKIVGNGNNQISEEDWNALNKYQKTALIGFVYNCGSFKNFPEIPKAIKAKNYAAAAEAIKKGPVTGKGEPQWLLGGLVKRRYLESQLFLTK